MLLLLSSPDLVDEKLEVEEVCVCVGGGGVLKAGVQFLHLCNTLVAFPGLLYVFSLCFLFKIVNTPIALISVTNSGKLNL